VQLTFGSPLRIPGTFLWDEGKELDVSDATETYVQTLQTALQNLKPIPFLHKRDLSVFVSPDLATCSHVYVREDATRTPLQRPYKGPYRVIRRRGKVFTLDYGNKK